MILFLDIDGVFNSTNTDFITVEEYKKQKNKFKKEFGIQFLLPDRNLLPFINCINKYITEYGENSIKAVLSSTWRRDNKNINLLNELLYKKGLLDKEFIISKTDIKHDCKTKKDRGNQINRWIKRNKPRNFVVLDDEFETMIHYGRLYNTKLIDGFTEEDELKFFKHLKKWTIKGVNIGKINRL